MADPAPLFVASRTVLKDRLRLRGMQAEGEYILSETIEKVRSHFVRRLGVSRVTLLVAIPYVQDTLDPTSILRTIANTTEVMWIRLELLRAMPVLLGDGTGSAQAVWNDESVWQQISEESRAAEIMRLQMEVEEALGILSGDEELGDEVKIKVTTIGPSYERQVGSSAKTWVSP